MVDHRAWLLAKGGRAVGIWCILFQKAKLCIISYLLTKSVTTSRLTPRVAPQNRVIPPPKYLPNKTKRGNVYHSGYYLGQYNNIIHIKLWELSLKTWESRNEFRRCCTWFYRQNCHMFCEKVSIDCSLPKPYNTWTYTRNCCLSRPTSLIDNSRVVVCRSL